MNKMIKSTLVTTVFLFSYSTFAGTSEADKIKSVTEVLTSDTIGFSSVFDVSLSKMAGAFGRVSTSFTGKDDYRVIFKVDENSDYSYMCLMTVDDEEDHFTVHKVEHCILGKPSIKKPRSIWNFNHVIYGN